MEMEGMDNKVELSVIVPVYGTEKYIDKCLTSALEAVEELSAEIVVINDGTKDNAGMIAQEYALKYQGKIIYFEKENEGLAATKNYGLKLAKGEFVTFLDSDDYIEPETYKEMLKAQAADNSDCVVCDIQCDYESEGKSEYLKCIGTGKDDFGKLMDTSLVASSCNKIIRRELMQGLDFPTGRKNEDVAVTPVAMARCKKLTYIPKAFYHYIQREGSIQNSSYDEKSLDILDMCKLALDRASEPIKNKNVEGTISEERIQAIRDSIYVYQVLSVPFHNIKREPLNSRYTYLKEFMDRAKQLFPDLYENPAVIKFTNRDTEKKNAYRKICLWLMKHRLYRTCSILWSITQKLAD